MGALLLNFGTAKLIKKSEFEIILRYFFTYFRQENLQVNFRLFSDLTNLVENFFPRFSTAPATFFPLPSLTTFRRPPRPPPTAFHGSHPPPADRRMPTILTKTGTSLCRHPRCPPSTTLLDTPLHRQPKGADYFDENGHFPLSPVEGYRRKGHSPQMVRLTVGGAFSAEPAVCLPSTIAITRRSPSKMPQRAGNISRL